MKRIDTTATKISRIKSLAKKIKKEKDIKLSAALEEAAKQLGYENYNHAMLCFKVKMAKKLNSELPRLN
jgi:hypothetical protein